MKLKKIFVKTGTAFSSKIVEWSTSHDLEVEEISLEDRFDEQLDGLVIFNQNSDIEKELLDIRKLFDDSLKPVQRIDINGTLMVGVSNFSLWLERNGCTKVLFVGSDKLVENPNLARYLDSMKSF